MTAPEENAVPSPPPVDPSEQLELKLPDESAAWKDIGLWAGVLVLLSLVAFWPAIGGTFQWLDDRAVAHNRMLAAPGGLSEAWTARWDKDHESLNRFPVYQPMAFTADWLAYRLGGHDDNFLPAPTAYHVVALVCHVGAAVLAWLVLRELLVPAAWLIAAVFALHPVNAEAVSWINEGGVPVGGLLFWGSAYSYFWYLKFRDRDAAAAAAPKPEGATDDANANPGGDPAQTWGVYSAAVLLAILAALAWPPAGVVPGFLLLALWWRRRVTTLDVLLLAPVLVVTAILWLTNFAIPRHATAGAFAAVADAGPARIISIVGEAIGFAVMKVIVPYPLALLYRTSFVGGLVTLLLAAAAVAGAVLLAVRRDVRWPAAVLGMVILGVVPALNWFDGARLSERVDPIAYLAVVPLAAVVIAGVGTLIRRVRTGEAYTQAVVVVAAALLVVLGATAWSRAHVFDNPVSLWEDAAAKSPRSTVAAVRYGDELRLRAAQDAADQDADKTKQDLDASIAQASHAFDLATALGDVPAGAAAQRTWALALVSSGDSKGALPHFALSTAANPGDAATLVQYGQALVVLGDNKAAITQLDRALAADPRSGTAHRLLGRAYRKLGNHKRFELEEARAVTLDPTDMAAQQLLAEALTESGHLEDALKRYAMMFASNAAVRSRADLWAAIGHIKDRQGKYDESVAYFGTAQQLDPTLPNIDKDLATAKAKLKVAAVTRPAMTRPSTAPSATLAVPTTGPATFGPAVPATAP